MALELYRTRRGRSIYFEVRNPFERTAAGYSWNLIRLWLAKKPSGERQLSVAFFGLAMVVTLRGRSEPGGDAKMEE